VSESRVEGVSQILMKYPDTQTVLLDDAYQHREIRPALNLLLTEYDRPFFKDFFLPFGRLREWKSAYKRADAVIVTKCPSDMNEDMKDNFIKEIKLKDHQRIFFSFYKYYDPYFIYDNQRKLKLTSDKTVILISALASISYLINYLEQIGCDYHSLEYNDHHDFSYDEIENLHKIYTSLNSDDKIILTTEKDAMRLNEHRKYLIDNKLPIFVLPVSVDFLFGEKNLFDDYIKNFLLNFKS
jgi:tetraacyldisaccharide 4'-kinase